MRFLFALLFLAISSPITWSIYTDSVNHFKINYPEKWTQQPMNQAIVFLRPAENDSETFKENVNVMMQDLSSQPMDLEQYTALTKKQIETLLKDAEIYSLKDITLAGLPAKEMIYKMDYQGLKLKLKQNWLVKGNTAYVLTYTAAPSQYDKYDGIATEMMKSFKFME